MRAAARAVLYICAAGSAACQRQAREETPATAPTPAPAIIGPDQGEHLLLGRRAAPLTIKVSPRIGARRLLMGTETLTAGDAIPVHRHERDEEILFVHAGRGTAVVGDHRREVTAGSTIFVPPGTWHAIENTSAADVEVLWVFSRPGMDAYFRAIGVPPGHSPRALTDEESEEIERAHGIRYRAH